MEFRVVTEFIMIMIVLSLGLLIMVTVTPMLQSINKPRASPLVEVIYTFSYYNQSSGTYNWTAYIYVYDPSPVFLEKVFLAGGDSLTINRMLINGDDVTSGFTSYLLKEGLNNITITFTATNLGSQVLYSLHFQGGYILSDYTVVKTVV